MPRHSAATPPPRGRPARRRRVSASPPPSPSPSPSPGEAADLRASTTKRPRPAPRPRGAPVPRLPPGADPTRPAPGWRPPPSPHALIEEGLCAGGEHDAWRLLVACVLLNKTTARAARRVLPALFAVAPTPAAAAAADAAALASILRPLGLQNRRAASIVALATAFAAGGWRDPAALPGVGQYAADAYWIFIAGQWEAYAASRGGAAPADKDLRRYVEFLEATGGKGAGFEREAFAF